MSQTFLDEVDELIRARYTMLYVVTWEEERARSLIARVASKQGKALYEWSITEGLHSVVGHDESRENRHKQPMAILQEILQSGGDVIYLLRDFHHYIEEHEVIRRLRDLDAALKRTRKTIVFLSPVLTLPQELEKAVTIVDLPLPSYHDLQNFLFNVMSGSSRNFKVQLNDNEKDAMIKAALGLTLSEAENAFSKAIVRDGVLEFRDLEIVAAEKRQIIRKTEVLEYVEFHESMGNVGGMDLLKNWLKKRIRAFTEDARAYGLPQPRGILLMGVQGCGKSLIAKTIAASWRLPLLRLDMSRIFHSYIGSSEQNMRKAMRIAESIAPVVLWIDEIEKAFSGAQGSADSDSGTSARVLGTFLTWIQEKTAPVFVVATANRVEGLPPELLRKGRLNEVFFVDLPSPREISEIFAIHLKKKNRDPAKFDLKSLAQAAAGFSGAEIEQAVVSALHDSFFERREVTTEDIVKSIRETVPLSVTMREQIEALRAWSIDRARPVSSDQLGVRS